MRARIRDRFASSTTTHLGRNRTRHPHRNPAQDSRPAILDEIPCAGDVLPGLPPALKARLFAAVARLVN